jgi:hypothetical protein
VRSVGLPLCHLYSWHCEGASHRRHTRVRKFPAIRITQAFGVINKKLDAILQDLDVIKAQQAQLINDVRDLARLVQSNFSEAIARLNRIEVQVNAIRGEVLTIDRRNHQKEFFDAIDYCQSAIRNNDWTTRPGDFRDRLTSLYGFGIHTAKLPSLTGDPSFGPTVSDFSQALRASGYVDLAFGLLPVGAGLLGVTIQHGANYTVPEPTIYANPICWAMGANAYLEARISTPNLLTQDDPSYLPALWNEGMRLRDVVRACTGNTIKSKLVEALEPLAGAHRDAQRVSSTSFISIIEQVVQSFQLSELTPRYQLQQIDWRSVRDGRIIYGTGPEKWAICHARRAGTFRCVEEPATAYLVANDPVDFLIRAGIIERKYVPFVDAYQDYINNGGKVFPQSASQLLIKSGPRAGQFVSGADARLFETDTTGDPTWKVRIRAWNPLQSRPGGRTQSHCLMNASTSSGQCLITPRCRRHFLAKLVQLSRDR